MPSTSSTGVVGLAVLCLTLAAGAAAALAIEGGIFFRAGATAVERSQEIGPDPMVGLSSLSMTSSLNDCSAALLALNSGQLPALTEEQGKAMVANCSALASKTLASSASNSLGWFVSAFTAAETGNFEAFNANLVRSQMTGPTEQWLAELRVDLAERYLVGLDADGMMARDDDLRLLISSGIGLRRLAQRYIADESFRGRIGDVLETVSPGLQQRFINNLNQAVDNVPRQ